MFEKGFLQIVTHILQKAFFKHALGQYGFSLFKMSTQRVGILNYNPPASRVGATVAAYYQDNTHDKDCETQTFYSENKCEKCTINMVTKFWNSDDSDRIY